jgi:hypothetical protein
VPVSGVGKYLKIPAAVAVAAVAAPSSREGGVASSIGLAEVSAAAPRIAAASAVPATVPAPVSARAVVVGASAVVLDAATRAAMLGIPLEQLENAAVPGAGASAVFGFDEAGGSFGASRKKAAPTASSFGDFSGW